MNNLTEKDKDFIARTVRVEVRFALRDLYHRMGYDAASAVGGYQARTHPCDLDYEWVYEKVNAPRAPGLNGMT